ncbi:MAG: response regulator [Spirochaetaceae bacterium]|nr:MAG: response regulator [Spirochaetaceae bacterium]
MAKIMIIDDDLDLAEDLSFMLKNAGHETSTRDDTEGVVALLMENRPDLVILDVMFPENPAGGFDLAREIRNTPAIKDLPVILLTAINQEFPMDFSSRDIDPEWMPVQDFLEKPVAPEVLLEKVDDLLKRA